MTNTAVTSITTTAVVSATGPTSAATAPLLITPTPDRSAEIMQYVIANTRHFTSELNALVTIVEFSDFQ